jgi:hypothetical protein
VSVGEQALTDTDEQAAGRSPDRGQNWLVSRDSPGGGELPELFCPVLGQLIQGVRVQDAQLL